MWSWRLKEKIMTQLPDAFDLYRRILFTDANGEVCWWYCGTVFSEIKGLGNVPISQAETIMLYRTEMVSADCFKVHWKEVGYFRDIATGEILQSWFNPFSGKTVKRASGLEDGPAYYTVSRADTGHNNFSITLTQAHANVHSVKLETTIADGRVCFVQSEDKTRTYQRPDGSWPDLDSADASTILTVLSIYGSIDDARANPTFCPGAGFYSSGPVGKGTGAWSGTVVRGVMKKAAIDEQLNTLAWQRLNNMYPDFFNNGKVEPDWD